MKRFLFLAAEVVGNCPVRSEYPVPFNRVVSMMVRYTRLVFSFGWTVSVSALSSRSSVARQLVEHRFFRTCFGKVFRDVVVCQ